MKLTKLIFNAICQYLKEIIAMCFAVAIWIDEGNFVAGVVMGMVLYVLMGVVLFIGLTFRTPRKCKILHLSGKTVCMKPLYYKNKQQFIIDFENIVDYAKNKGYKYINMKTHKVILDSLLKEYIEGTSRMVRNKCKNLGIEENIETDTLIGKIVIRRTSDGMNRCARYEYHRIMTHKQFFRTLNSVEMYDITILFFE